jgi:hypothetical protein
MNFWQKILYLSENGELLTNFIIAAPQLLEATKELNNNNIKSNFGFATIPAQIFR